MLGPAALLLGLSLASAAPATGVAPAPAARTRQRAPGPRELTALERLDRWVAALAGGGGALDPAELVDAGWVLADVALAWESRPGDAREVARPVLDLYGHLLAREHAGKDQGLTALAEGRARDQAGELLRARAPDIRSWLAREVLPLGRLHPLERRAAAARVLAADRSQEGLMALFTCTRDPAPLLRDEAVAALCGRRDDAVHALLLDLLEGAEAGRVAVRKSPIERHFRELRPDLASPVYARLEAYVRARIAGDDWRRASRALAVGSGLTTRTAAPILVDALAAWCTRAAGGLPSRRIEGELLRELERRSGRRLGLHPESWRKWCAAVEAGELDVDGEGGGTATFAKASFFGLHPMTDRVTFVLDRSGSMQAGFGPSTGTLTRPSNTRLHEAVTQMSACLELLGPTTLFDVVLFSDGARSWRKRLEPATAANVAAAARWVLEIGSGGGTHLRTGVEAAMCLDSAGRPRLEELEADTIIVLCDGETAEGPGWVRPFLQRVNDDARVLFHAVRIGTAGDATLRALCEETGGDFVQVDG